MTAARDPWPGVVREPVEELRKVARRRASHEVYPGPGLELAALVAVPFQKVRVVIVGLDPYPGEGLATGLAFAVPEGTERLPDGLRSIHAALRHDRYEPPVREDLTGWADQGVLLLNRALTFEVGSPRAGGHLPIWRDWTNEVIAALNDRAEPVVFALWGRKAQRVPLIDTKRHTVITAPHPSSRGAYRTEFQQAGTFLRINKALGKPTIDWARG